MFVIGLGGKLTDFQQFSAAPGQTWMRGGKGSKSGTSRTVEY